MRRHLLDRTLEPRLISPAIVAGAAWESVRSPRQRGARRLELRAQPLAAHAAQEPRGRAQGALAGRATPGTTRRSTARALGRHDRDAGARRQRGRPACRSASRRIAGTSPRTTCCRRRCARPASRARSTALGAEELAALLAVAERRDRRHPHGRRGSQGSTPCARWGEPPTSSCPRAFVEIKGHTYLLQALSLLAAARDVGAQLELAGEGSERARSSVRSPSGRSAIT